MPKPLLRRCLRPIALIVRLSLCALLGATIGAMIGASSFWLWANSVTPPLSNILADVPNAAQLGILLGGLSGLVLGCLNLARRRRG